MRKNKGITLIALVVTIVVLLIITGVSVSMFTGDNGIISQAKKAKEETTISEEKEQVERLLINADILKELNGEKVCSVGGLLIFGKMPQRYLPQNGITFAHFNGSEISDELIDKKVIEGRIQDIAENTLTIIKNNILAPSVIKNLKRVEATGTIEEKIVELQNRKKELIDNMINDNLSNAQMLSSISEEEIIYLLQ